MCALLTIFRDQNIIDNFKKLWKICLVLSRKVLCKQAQLAFSKKKKKGSNIVYNGVMFVSHVCFSCFNSSNTIPWVVLVVVGSFAFQMYRTCFLYRRTFLFLESQLAM